MSYKHEMALVAERKAHADAYHEFNKMLKAGSLTLGYRRWRLKKALTRLQVRHLITQSLL